MLVALIRRFNYVLEHCEVAGCTFAFLVVWYSALVVCLVKGGYATFEWGQRLLIYPNLGLAIASLFGVGVLFSTYRNHADDAFAKSLEVFNAVMLFINTFYCYQIGSKAIPLGHKFAWQTILFSTSGFLLLWGSVLFLYRQWYVHTSHGNLIG